MKARKHRELFEDSIATMTEIPATFDAVSKFFNIPKSDIVFFGGECFDKREPWNDAYWYVTHKDGGVYGMVSERVKP